MRQRAGNGCLAFFIFFIKFYFFYVEYIDKK